jgi:chaperonin GroEL
VARDFLGEAPGFLVSNHHNPEVPMSILLVKVATPDNDHTVIQDIATYLNGTVVSEKRGALVGKLTADDFVLADKVYSFRDKTVLVTNSRANPELSILVESLRAKKEENPEDEETSRRLASLTAGTVSLQVGAATGPELRELIYRYEDAINATRAAMRSGYVAGGGVTLYQATRELDEFAKEFGLSGIKQIALNCEVEFDESKYGGNIGYDAYTETYVDMYKAGVIEPYDVFKHSLTNAVSVSTAILTSGWFIVNKKKKDDRTN